MHHEHSDTLGRAQIRQSARLRADPYLVGNQIYLLSVLLAHNLGRELQMSVHPPSRTTLAKRPALWNLARLDTLRRRLIQRAGRLIRPQGQLTLSMSANRAVQQELLHYLVGLKAA